MLAPSHRAGLALSGDHGNYALVWVFGGGSADRMLRQFDERFHPLGMGYKLQDSSQGHP